VLHRADLQRILYNATIRAGASIAFGKNVTVLDANEASLTFEDGSTVMGDLIVGADGVPSSPSHSYRIEWDVLCNER
jgi:2-polyprenyl-6-methoxyphenol hydroxylase-like FAD-dependent oxidoreductase